jgi:hypothetical protein
MLHHIFMAHYIDKYYSNKERKTIDVFLTVLIGCASNLKEFEDYLIIHYNIFETPLKFQIYVMGVKKNPSN